MTDQLCSDHVSFNRGARMSTPNLERFKSGVVFRNAVTVNPVSSPARTALVTGKYPHQIGMQSMSGCLDPGHPTFTRALQNAGYFVGIVGKLHWHQPWPWGTPFRTRRECRKPGSPLGLQLLWGSMDGTAKLQISLRPHHTARCRGGRRCGTSFRSPPGSGGTHRHFPFIPC